MYKYLSFLFLLLFFVSCKSAEDSFMEAANGFIKKSDEVDTTYFINNKDYSGEYTQSILLSNSKIVVSFKLVKDQLTTRIYNFPYKEDLTIANYIENVGTVSFLGDSKVSVNYTKSSCFDFAKEEEVEISGDPNSMILVKYDTTTAILENNSDKKFSEEGITLLTEITDCSKQEISTVESANSGNESTSEDNIIINGKDFSGKYIFDYSLAGNKRKVLYVELFGNKFTGREYVYPFSGNKTIVRYSEKIGKVTLLDSGKLRVDFSYETCGDIKTQEFELSGNPESSIKIKYQDLSVSLNTIDGLTPIDDIKIMAEDKSCGNEASQSTVSTLDLPVPAIDIANTTPDNYSALLNQVQCRSGTRLSSIFVFNSNNFSGSSATTISGTFTPGGIGGTEVAREYIGVGYYGDVMIVQKVTSSSKVIGYNVLISMCSMSSTNGAPYVSDSRQLTSFSGTITLDDEVSCGHGMVDASQTTMHSQVDPNYSYLPIFQVDTWFTKVGCISY